MKLMTDEIKQKLIKAHEKEQQDYENYIVDEQEVVVKYFHPGRYTFYAISGEEVDDDIIMFGYVLSPITPDFDEYGYVSLKELESIPLMERDLYFPKKKLGDVVNEQ